MPCGRPLALVLGRGPRQQQDLVGNLGRRGPHLAARHAVAARHALGEGLDAGGVEPGIGLRHAETRLLIAAHQRRQPALLLLRRPMHDDGMRPEHVDVDGGSRRIAAAARRRRLHHDGRLGHAQPGAAHVLGHGDAEPAAFRHGAIIFFRKAGLLLAFGPILIVETGAHPADALVDCDLVLRKRKFHVCLAVRRAAGKPAAPGRKLR